MMALPDVNLPQIPLFEIPTFLSTIPVSPTR